MEWKLHHSTLIALSENIMWQLYTNHSEYLYQRYYDDSLCQIDFDSASVHFDYIKFEFI